MLVVSSVNLFDDEVPAELSGVDDPTHRTIESLPFSDLAYLKWAMLKLYDMGVRTSPQNRIDIRPVTDTVAIEYKLPRPFGELHFPTFMPVGLGLMPGIALGSASMRPMLNIDFTATGNHFLMAQLAERPSSLCWCHSISTGVDGVHN